MHKQILLLLLLLSAMALMSGCPVISPDSQKQIQSQTKVPGLDEAVLAKDRALQSAIEISWASDPELLQEQLAVDDIRAGKVRITGIVSREELKRRAEAVAEQIDGVIEVVSTITVDESLKDKRINLDEAF